MRTIRLENKRSYFIVIWYWKSLFFFIVVTLYILEHVQNPSTMTIKNWIWELITEGYEIVSFSSNTFHQSFTVFSQNDTVQGEKDIFSLLSKNKTPWFWQNTRDIYYNN